MTPSSGKKKKGSSAPVEAHSHTTLHGEVYYLHEGRTPTGRPRYFAAKTIRETALAAMPEGYAFAETVVGVVTIRKVTAATLEKENCWIAQAQKALNQDLRLRRHRVGVVKGEILLYEPVTNLTGPLPEHMRPWYPVVSHTPRYEPALKLVPDRAGGEFTLFRMTHRGDGGWSYPLDTGSLDELLKKYLPYLGTEDLFNLV